MEYVVIIIIALLALVSYASYLYGQRHPKKAKTASPDFNPDYLKSEEPFTFNGKKINQYQHYKYRTTYAEILMVTDPTDPAQCEKLVMIKLSQEENIYNSETVNHFFDELNNQKRLIEGCWTHIVVEQDGKFFVAYVYLRLGGTLGRSVDSLASDYCCFPEEGYRFLLP